jgi:hypothetical protein
LKNSHEDSPGIGFPGSTQCEGKLWSSDFVCRCEELKQ